MTTQDQGIFEMISSYLSDDRLSGSIVYISNETIQAGEKLAAGDALISVPWEAFVVFVDFKPGYNWGHACCYLAINTHTNEIIYTTAEMPPFLKPGKVSYRLLWRSPLAPEWAVETGN